ncbi:MAG: hypothetical protein PF505_05650, partial [Vallitaleaceae bacterium]|nr:hypothetical protein [Vallitaleaceae bacterium]
ASCENKVLLDLGYFRFAYDIGVFDKKIIRYIWYNFIIFRDRYPLLINYYYKKYGVEPKLLAEDIIIPKDHQLVSRFIYGLIEDDASELMASLYKTGKLDGIEPEKSMKVIELISSNDPLTGATYAKELYGKRIFNEVSLTLVAKYFIGSYSELITLIEDMIKIDAIIEPVVKPLIEQFGILSALTRQNVGLVEILLDQEFLDLSDTDYKQVVVRFLAAGVIIEEY